MAHDQALAIKELGLDKVSVMGVSQGGMIALALAINCPELINKLVLCVTSSCTNEMIETNINKWIGLAEEENHKELMVDTALKSYSEAYLSKYKRLLPLLSSLSKPKSYDRFLINAKAILNFDVVNDLDKIKCPTFVIGAKEDLIVGSEASLEIANKLKCPLYMYENLGHAAYEEASNFNQLVYDFLIKN
jgi:pimeloyl-ACP methyl ester carboxylesterase